MILNEQQIKTIVTSGTPDFIIQARKKRIQYNVHVNGRGLDKYLFKIDNIENEDQFQLRKKVAFSNKFLLHNILRPIDKVFSSKGGSKSYEVQGESNKDKLQKQLKDVRYGMPLRQWIQKIQANKYYSDPAGVIFFEVSKDGLETYPAMKSIDKIHNYMTDGRKVEWICFEPFKVKDSQGKEVSGNFFRLVDDAFDYTVRVDGDNVTIYEVGDGIVSGNPATIVNHWGETPAIVNSDILNDELTFAESPIEVLVGIADKYLRTNTIKSVHEFLHGYPFFWMYLQKCKSCKGTGRSGDSKCSTCEGTGVSIKKDVSDALLLKPPKTKDDAMVAPNVAGYVTPPEGVPEEQRKELNWMGQLMNLTMWGTTMVTSENETATAAFLDIQPVNDRLGQFSDTFEVLEEIMTKFIGKFYINDAFISSSISYGRRYLMESPDKIWEKYLNAKKDRGPKSSLNNLLTQYYQSEFVNDSITLNYMVKIMKLEPFIHDDYQDLINIVAKVDIQRKVYFNEWLNTTDENTVLATPLNQLRTQFNDYVKNLSLEENEES